MRPAAPTVISQADMSLDDLREQLCDWRGCDVAPFQR